jgi:protein-tyrosine phosphatase
MSTIIPNQLYLGNVLNVNRLQWLNQHNIQTIICVARKDDVVIRPDILSSKTVHQFDLRDDNEQCLDFDTVVDLIVESLRRGAVLVNCAVGMSRSPAFIMAFLMKTQHLTLNEAFVAVKRARPKINPNASFTRQLQEYEHTLRV